MPEKVYIYDINRGDGIPGLPVTVTKEQAKALGLLKELEAAIQNGSYVEIAVTKAAGVKEQSNG